MQAESPDDNWLEPLTGRRVGPYCSFNPVSRVQIWQWCSAMGDNNPLYLDDEYRAGTEYEHAVAPPAMMQMWTMRDINDHYAPGSTDEPPYRVFDVMAAKGFTGNVAVSYDIQFHRYLVEGDRAHHYTSIHAISDCKTTALGEGYFVTERVEYFDQHEQLFAEALITYFQYRPAKQDKASSQQGLEDTTGNTLDEKTWQSDYRDISFEQLQVGDKLPELIIPITHKLIVGGAIATQDFIPVHHNAEAAKAAAMPNIFMNILTTSGLSARYLSDWAGPGSRLKSLRFKLMAPNTPGDTMTLQGKVKQLHSDALEKNVEVEFAGNNSLGLHVGGSATLTLSA